MCGIAGIVGKWQGATGTTASQMLRSVHHRGPDDHGTLVYSAGTACTGRGLAAPPHADAILLHRRLSIIDLSEGGWQPLSTPDGRYHVVFNGEIYNYVELRSELQAAGVAFRSQSDTEVLLQAFVHWGHEAWPRFNGMFACAILDTAKDRVTLARDPFGIKPLYYVTRPGALAFASEIKTLLPLPGVGRTVDPQRLAAYLRFGITDHGESTLFSAVKQVPAGAVVDVEIAAPASVTPRTYWAPSRADTADLSFEEAARTFRALFLESVALHMRSDVPVACCLSGGIDSSSIVMAMREVSGASLELHTFSHIAQTAALNEEWWIDLAAAAGGARLHKVSPTAAEMAADLERLVGVQDEPFITSSIYAQYRVMRAIGEAGVKVVLDGQGADEMLGGYEFYLGARVASLLRAGRLGAAATLMRRARRSRGIPAFRQFASAMDFLLPPAGSALARRLIGRDLVPPWVNGAWLRAHGVHIDSLRTSSDADVLLESLERSIRGPGLAQLLRYEDRNSMAWSVESRVPFLSTKLVDFALALPERYIIGDDGTTKHVFRAAMRGLVPSPVLDRRDKIGFATSEREWILALAPWVERLLAHEAAQRIPALAHAAVLRHWRAIKDGRRRYDNGVWRWINLIEWTRQYEVQYG
jgi:asparagine synthase (glutamine-hydrolysing)